VRENDLIMNIELLKIDSRKKCTKCHEIKLINQFHKDITQKNGISCACKSCKAKYAKTVSRDLIRARALKYQFGLSVDEYNEIFLKQNGSCAICLRHQSEFQKRLSVDHCHSTNLIRGLLCFDCNIFLGHAKDNVGILNSAIKYLNKGRK
jgi:hypothetical protein